MIKIDILLVTYNQEQFIRQALDSILMQRLNDDVRLRIIVADDCSTDKTYDIIHDILGDSVQLGGRTKADVIYLPRISNLGHVRNYQRAFANCDGDYVAILEGDDYWSNPLHLQIHLDFLDIHRECVLTTQRPTWYFEEEQRFMPTAIFKFPEGDYKYITIEEEICVNRIVNLSSCLIRGEAIRHLDERVFNCSVLDWPMYINISQMGLLCLLAGTSNVYRAKKSGLYAGLDATAALKMDAQLLNEIENIFPQYADSYQRARHLMRPKQKTLCRKFIECILLPFAILSKFGHRIHVVFNDMKK